MIHINIKADDFKTKDRPIESKIFPIFISLLLISILFIVAKTVVYAKEPINVGHSNTVGVCTTYNDQIDLYNIFQDPKDGYLSNFEYDSHLKVVNIVFNNKRYPVITNASDVRTLLYGQLNLDSSRFFADNYGVIFNGKNIFLHVKSELSLTEYKDIPFNIETKNDPDIEYGKVVVAKEGKVGKLAQVYRVIKVDDKIISKKLINTYVAVEPKTEIRKLGTKKVYKTIVINGQKIKYWRTLRVWATSYDSNCAGCSHYTATGKYLTKGIIAVDPKVIPLHTHLYVPGYGFGQAEDVGGAIKGNKIDLGFDDLSKHQGEWSARWVTIYILD